MKIKSVNQGNSNQLSIEFSEEELSKQLMAWNLGQSVDDIATEITLIFYVKELEIEYHEEGCKEEGEKE